VKANTYFCNHCESVFKYVDPTKARVVPSFCACGNPVQAAATYAAVRCAKSATW